MGEWTDKAKQLETQERRNFVIDLRKSGATYRQIADATLARFGVDNLPQGWDERYAYKDVARELDKLKSLNNGLSEDVRELELQRLDAMLLALWPQASKGNQGAVDRVLRIMERRAKFLGTDKPTRSQNINIDVSTLSTEQLERIASGEDIFSVISTTSES